MSGIMRFKRLLRIPGQGVTPRRFSATSEASVVSSEANPRQQVSSEGAEQQGDGNGGGFQNKERYATRFLKFLLGGTFTAAFATAAYASYAYTTEEIEQMTSSMRNSTTYSVPDDASAVDRVRGFLYSTTMAVPAKATELYLDARRTIEDYVKGFAAPSSDKLLPDLAPQEQHVFTLVLDLNETLIYSDWKVYSPQHSYKAMTTMMKKENPPIEIPWPILTMAGRYVGMKFNS